MSEVVLYEPAVTDFIYVALASVVFSVLRYASERAVFGPLHQKWGTHWKKHTAKWTKSELVALRTGLVKFPLEASKDASEQELQEASDSRWKSITDEVNTAGTVGQRSMEETRAKHQSLRSASKMAEAGWKAVNWTTFVIIGLTVSYNQPWFTDTVALWAGYPFKMTAAIKFYYLAELGWYVHSQGYLMIMESETGQKRTDFIMMTVHHCATLTLIAWSYMKHYTPIGCMILWVHDISDIFLETGLCLKEINFHPLIIDACFALLTISWFILRLVLFPFVLVGSIAYTLYEVCPRLPAGLPGGESSHIQNVWQHFADPFTQPLQCYSPHWYFLILSILCVLHVIWFAMIVRMIIRAFRTKGNRHDDIRDKED